MFQSVAVSKEEGDLLQNGRHPCPHRFLGLHKQNQEEKIIRLWAPLKKSLLFEYRGKLVEAVPSDFSGLFTYVVPASTTLLDYRILHANGLIGQDPYAFLPTVSKGDIEQFCSGTHYTIYEVLGSHLVKHQGVFGVKFAVWAPRAKKVSLISDCNHWKEGCLPMRRVEGVWEIFIPGVSEGLLYKYAIGMEDGSCVYKSDPYAYQFELRPKTASVVSCPNEFVWQDRDWMEKRKKTNVLEGPVNIYEMHLGSWKKNGKEFPNYRDLAKEIVPYIKEMGYTHVELMPIMEHPLDESWGYQVTGYYAPTSRFGSLKDFQYLVNDLHIHQIGVVLDWSPGHFPDDACALSYFDGGALYEKNHPIMARHPEWFTKNFDYGRKEVSNFLIGSVLFWLDKMHVDGIRVDAVQSMLYLDYGRRGGDWVPNCYGGKENLEAIEFLKHLNSIVHQKFPKVFMVAEDASLFEGVTKPVEWGGLGFDLKWNIGWMNDSLFFMKKDPLYRKYHMPELTRSFSYMFSERYLLAVSHDEVVHEKRSLFGKMPLDDWCKFAQMRLYYSSSLCHPGKNLFFMGIELAEKEEWDCKGELNWNSLHDPQKRRWKRFVREMNRFYITHPPLWEIDFDQRGFAWVDYQDHQNCVISYIRKGFSSQLVCVHNYTPNSFQEYIIKLPFVKEVKELFNSDDERYGGSGQINGCDGFLLRDRRGFCVKMPPLATMIFEVTFDREERGV